MPEIRRVNAKMPAVLLWNTKNMHAFVSSIRHPTVTANHLTFLHMPEPKSAYSCPPYLNVPLREIMHTPFPIFKLL